MNLRTPPWNSQLIPIYDAAAGVGALLNELLKGEI